MVAIALLVPVVSMAVPLPAVTAPAAPAQPAYYGPGLCASAQYECLKIQPGQNWEKLFPDAGQRDLVQRINRCYNALWPGKIIAVPRDLAHVMMIELAPFPHQIEGDTEKQVIVDQDK